MRLFIAINFEDEVKRGLLAMQRHLRDNAACGNFTRPENLHLTVVFIGETPPARLPDIQQVMEAVDTHAFTLTIRGLGCFKRGGLYWAGVEAPPELPALHRQLSDSLTQQGFKIERKPYTPHLTLAREVMQKNNAGIPAFSEDFAMVVPVSRISLMASERIRGSLTYTEVHARIL